MISFSLLGLIHLFGCHSLRIFVIRFYSSKLELFFVWTVQIMVWLLLSCLYVYPFLFFHFSQ